MKTLLAMCIAVSLCNAPPESVVKSKPKWGEVHMLTREEAAQHDLEQKAGIWTKFPCGQDGRGPCDRGYEVWERARAWH